MPRDQIIAMARQFADNADKTRQVHGHHRRGHEPLVPLRHELPRHHQHADDVRLHRPKRVAAGRTTSGWEKLRPQTGWTALALRWTGSARRASMNSTSFFYATPTSGAMKAGHGRNPRRWPTRRPTGSMIDYNVRAERMGWLPSRRSSRPTPCRW